MFGCCCANKKALKNKEQKNGETKPITTVVMVENDTINPEKSPIKSPETLITSPMSPLSESSGVMMTRNGNNDKSNSSEEGNNLSGLIMSDGLVGESCYCSYMYILNHVYYFHGIKNVPLFSSHAAATLSIGIN